MPDLRPVRSLICVATVALICAAAPSGALADPVAPTITAVGVGQVKPTPVDRKSDVSIRKAVDAAVADALPRAVADARAHAVKLAAAAGLRLGALLSIGDTPSAGYPFFYSPQNGTVGPGRFCANQPNVKTIVNKDGSRRRVVLKGTHKVCRVPPTVSASVSLTYAVAP